jgi:monoamine oxidase
MSIYLGEQIKKKGGEIKMNFYVKEIHQNENICTVIGEDGTKIEADYLVIAMPPCSTNKIQFTPQLST